MKAAIRDSWTAYAESIGTLHPAPKEAKPTKYGNTTVQVDGHWFDSKKEAARYHELKYLQAAGLIADLELQPEFPLHVMELFRSGPIVIRTIGTFTADFRFTDLQVFAKGEIVVEDVKGGQATKTEAYALRKKLAEAIHGISIREV